MAECCPPMIFEDNFVQRCNMAWRVEPGHVHRNNPLLAGQYPWDEATPFYKGTVLKDPGDSMSISFGMCGLGGRDKDFLREVERLDWLALGALCDLNEALLAEWGERLGITQLFNTYEDLLASDWSGWQLWLLTIG